MQSKDFKRSCGDYHVALRECEAKSAVVGPSVIRIKFKLGRGQALQGLASHLEDIGREMKRTGVIIQQVPNSDELLLDVPRLQREKVLFKDPSVKEITINSEIEDYYKEFMKCIEKGMTYCAFSIRLHEQTPELYAKIKITI